MPITSFLRRIISSSAAGPALPYFSTLSHKQSDLGGVEGNFGGGWREISIALKIWVLLFSTNFYEYFLTIRKLQRNVIINIHIY